jgi:hypothetical protein
VARIYKVNYDVIHQELLDSGCTEQQIAVFFERRTVWLAENIKQAWKASRWFVPEQTVEDECREPINSRITDTIEEPIAGNLIRANRHERLRTLGDVAKLSVHDLLQIDGIRLNDVYTIHNALYAHNFTPLA